MNKKERITRRLADALGILICGGICTMGILALLGAAYRAETNAVPSQQPAPEVTLHIVREYAELPDLGNLTEEPALYIAKTVWGEARGCNLTEQAAVVWCILNRVDSELAYMPDDIISVVTQPGQFSGYDPDNPVTDEIYDLVVDVLCRWAMEPSCVGDVGRVLPREYLWFVGDGKRNHFVDEWRGTETWDWSLDSPYGDGL